MWTALASTVDCQCWGEGGNGATSQHGSHGGYGGGGGEYAEEITLALTVSNSYSFTIGSGGTSTNTSFPGDAVTVTAHYGVNGSSLGAGGTGSGNSIHHDGGAGSNGVNGSGNVGGGGGGGSAGAGGAGGAGSNSGSGPGPGGSAGAGSPGGATGGNGGSSANPGSNGNAPGSGAGGGGATSSASHAGGTGANGQITIVYTSSVPGTATLAGVGTLTATGSSFNPNFIPGPRAQPGATWLRHFARWRHPVPWGPQIQKLTASATLSGVGTMVAMGGLPNPVVVNQWANSYGQGTTFTSITSALQSCVVGLNPGNQVGPGSGTPTAGNWLFTIASWTQDPSIISVHVGVGDDGHSWWREFPAAGAYAIPGVVSYWDFNEGTDFADTGSVVNDEVGGNNGTWNGTLGSQWGTGIIKSGGVFDGTTNYVDCGNGTSFGVGNFGALSISCWIKPAAGTQNGFATILGKGGAYWIEGDGSGSGTYQFGLQTGSGFHGTGLHALTAGSWNHYVLSWDGTTATVYINGSVVSTTTIAGPLADSGGNDWLFGQRAGFTRFFKGSIDETGLWNVALTSAQVATLYNSGAGIPLLAGLTRTSIAYTPNITSQVQNVYVAPDGEIAAVNVLVIEVAGLGPWDTVKGTNVNYAPAATSLSLSLGAPGQASFIIGGVGGDNIASGQAFLPSGWQGLATQTQTNGSNALADNILTAAFLPSTNGSVSVSGTASSSEDMSGFLLSVKVSGNSPIPASQNPNWPYMVFEAGFGAGFNTPDSEITWTDLTSRMWDWEETTGIQFQLGQVQATDLTMHLDDLDGYLIPTNAASPYYPNVQPGTPVRLRGAIGTMGGVSVNRWYVIQRNATQWGEQIDEVFRRWCPVSGSDLWAALSSVPPTFYRSEVYEDAPYAWWPCDDQPGNAGVLPVFLLNAALGNTNVMNILLSPNGGAKQQYSSVSGASGTGLVPPGLATYTVGANAGWMYGDPQSAVAAIEAGNSVTATPGSASWQASGQAGSTGSFGWYLSCNDASFPPLSGGITVEAWFNAAFYGSAEGIFLSADPINDGVTTFNYSPVTQQPYSNEITILELATASAPVAILQLNSSGHLNLITYNGGTGTSHSIYTASDLRSESWHMVTMTLTTSAWEVWLDGGANAHASGSGAGMTSAWTWLIGNADMGSGGGVNTSQIENGGNIALSHIAVYPYVLPYYRVLDHYWAAVTAFGQLPAPSGVQISWVPQAVMALSQPPSPSQLQPAAQVFTPDGTPPSGGGYPGSNGVSASAIVVATAPGGVVSGISAQATGVDGGQFVQNASNTTYWDSFFLWVTWTGVAPSFNVYTGNTTGTDNEAAVVNGDGISFTAGYGATANVTGVNKVSGGDGSAPPASASAIGDTVGQRIERLMRAGRVSSPNRCIDPAPLLVQAPGTTGGGQQVGAAIQAIQESDSGLLYVDNQNNLTYLQRPHLASQYSTPVWQLGPTSPRIPYYKEIEWVTDPQHIYNAITVAPLSPTGASLPLITPSDVTDVEASQVRYGAQPLQVTSWLQSIQEMQNQANFLFTTYGTPQRHVEKVKIDASGATPATLAASWELVMGVNCADVVQLEDWQVGGGGAVYTYRVTQVERHIEMGSGDNPATTGSVTLILDYEPTSYWS